MLLVEVLFEQTPSQVPPVQIIQHVTHTPKEPDSKAAPKQQEQPTQEQPVSPEQQIPQGQETGDEETTGEEIPEDGLGDGSQMQEEGIPPDLLPIKKYYLISKLKELKNQLIEYSLQNDELDILLKFADNLSYSSLLNVGLIITDVIGQQLARLKDGKNTN